MVSIDLAEVQKMIDKAKEELTAEWTAKLKEDKDDTMVTVSAKLKEEQQAIFMDLSQKMTTDMKVMQEVLGLKEKEKEKKEEEKSESEADEKDDQIKELQEELRKMKESKGEDKSSEKNGKFKQTMTSRRNFNALPKYSGKHEEYDHWKFKMTNFLSEEIEFKELILELEEFTEVPDESKANDLIKHINEKFKAEDKLWLNHQLYQVLSLNLEGKALTMIRNLNKQINTNGILGWCKLMQDCSSMTSQRMQGLASKVYQPKRVKVYSDVSAAIENWETDAQKFETIENHELKMTTKIFAIKQIVPEELENDIIKSTSLDTYEKIKAYIISQVASRRDVVKNSSKGPVALDLNMAEKMWSKMMGEKEEEYKVEENGEGENEECEDCGGGTLLENLFSFVKGQFGKGGKGGKDGGKGGKGKFDGQCHHCGTYGHRIADCWKKDAEMAKGKGKSKGDPFSAFGGKGGFGGFGGFGGKGKGKEGGKGKGKWGKGMYGFENQYENQYGYDESPSKAWTLSIIPNKEPQAPPGLKKVKIENSWKIFEKEDESKEEEKEQRAKDLKEMERERSEHFPKVPVGNYSKRSVKANRFPPIKAQKMKVLNLFCKDDAEVGEKKELFPVMNTNVEGWQWIKGVVDSGAAESVAHPSMCPQYPVKESVGSRAGHSYTSASGNTIPNLGEQVLPTVTCDGRNACIKYQSADVSRALNSVSEICDGGGNDGQLVLFSKYGGQILNLETGHRTPFEREEGIYTLGMWVRPNTAATSVFPRPGR